MIAAVLSAAARLCDALATAIRERATSFASREAGDFLDQTDADLAAADADFLDAMNCVAPVSRVADEEAATPGPAAVDPPLTTDPAAGHLTNVKYAEVGTAMRAADARIAAAIKHANALNALKHRKK